jgi:urocanate hydratase
MGVIRHVDAGYDEAKEFAAKTGVTVPEIPMDFLAEGERP